MKKTTIFLILTALLYPQAFAAHQSNNSQIRPAIIQTWLKKQAPLSNNALTQLVKGNSIISHTTHSHSLYQLYFYPNGKVLFRKAGDNKQVYLGKWWVKQNKIFSTWPSYKKGQINALQYYHLIDDIYVGYNMNDACGKAHTFCDAFMVVKGDPFRLTQLTLKNK